SCMAALCILRPPKKGDSIMKNRQPIPALFAALSVALLASPAASAQAPTQPEILDLDDSGPAAAEREENDRLWALHPDMKFLCRPEAPGAGNVKLSRIRVHETA